jgi:hypothetical protein
VYPCRRGDGCTGERADDVSRPPALGLATQKKSLHASERDTPRVQQARQDYHRRSTGLDSRRLKFVDESSVNLAMTRLYGRAPAGERVLGHVPQNYGQNVTMRGALGVHGLHAVMTIEGATDAEVFRAYVKHVLGSMLTPGDIVVMDNLRAHKAGGPAGACQTGASFAVLAHLFARSVAHRAVLVEGVDDAAQSQSAYVGRPRYGHNGSLGHRHGFGCTRVVSALRLCLMIIRKSLWPGIELCRLALAGEGSEVLRAMASASAGCSVSRGSWR